MDTCYYSVIANMIFKGSFEVNNQHSSFLYLYVYYIVYKIKNVN